MTHHTGSFGPGCAGCAEPE